MGQNMEQSNQIFIQIDPDNKPVEFLLLEQPLDMIKAGVVTKKQIRETIEKGFKHPNEANEVFTRVNQYEDHPLLLYITVEADLMLRYIKKIEQRIE